MEKQKYKMTLRVVIEKLIEVEAENYDEAYNKVQDQWEESSLGDFENDWVDYNIYEEE